MNIINCIPYGHENAITTLELMDKMGVDNRKLRRLINEARLEHAIINTQDGEGYFQPYPEEVDLVNKWLAQESNRVKSICKSHIGARNFIHKITENFGGDLNVNI